MRPGPSPSQAGGIHGECEIRAGGVHERRGDTAGRLLQRWHSEWRGMLLLLGELHACMEVVIAPSVATLSLVLCNTGWGASVTVGVGLARFTYSVHWWWARCSSPTRRWRGP